MSEGTERSCQAQKDSVHFLSSINFNSNLLICRFHTGTFPNWNKEGREKGLTFGAVLKACRERAGLTQEEIAEKLHRSRSCISKFETDKKTLDVATLIKWADVTSAKDVACAIVTGVDPVMILQQLMPLIGGIIQWF